MMMKFWLICRENYQKHLKDAERWVLPNKRERIRLEENSKGSYDAMQSLEYEINTLFPSMDKHLLLHLVSVWDQSF